MFDQQIVTVSFFKFRKNSARWKAFRTMGLSTGILPKVEGLSFGKMLGSGGKNGFSIFPNLSVYGLLGVWENEKKAQHFFQHHSFFRQLETASAECWTSFMRTAMVHGQWEGSNPFVIADTFDMDRPLAVLTRATIRTSRLLHFWRYVPQVSRSMNEHREGLLFSAGVGELPLVQQATVSFWENSRRMQAYAYQSRFHKEVIQKTRELGWYKEELFARFHPYKSQGNWNGKDPLKNYLKQTNK